MRTRIAILGSVLAGVVGSSLPALARDQVLTNCRENWRASQAALRANGINQKVFVAECQAAAAARADAPSTSPGSPASNPASAPPDPVTVGETLKVKAC